MFPNEENPVKKPFQFQRVPIVAFAWMVVWTAVGGLFLDAKRSDVYTPIFPPPRRLRDLSLEPTSRELPGWPYGAAAGALMGLLGGLIGAIRPRGIFYWFLWGLLVGILTGALSFGAYKKLVGGSHQPRSFDEFVNAGMIKGAVWGLVVGTGAAVIAFFGQVIRGERGRYLKRTRDWRY